ncbi:MAG: multicopper oxidase domain-containing protein [Rhodobacteraceae bacterium]|nr:multicopper oxidase domain-containing protein [Paracoccaceae bacterium]
MNTLSRRGFIAASASALAAAQVPRLAFAQAAPLTLRATTRSLDIDGRAATVFGLVNGTGGSGLILDPGARFRVDLTNDLEVETLIHWHGQIPPNVQDGVPDMPMPKLKPGEGRSYDFAPLAGTHWMHAHVPTHEMRLLAAPLIVRSAADVAADRQEVVLFLHDFSFKTPEEVLAEITGGGSHGTDAAPSGNMAGMDHAAMGNMAGMGQGTMAGLAMDLNDFDFDAYLANDRTLSDPEVIAVENGGRVRLRVINAAAATTFWIDTGALKGRLVAVDGHDVRPVAGHRFGAAMAQRLDIELDLPAGATAFPILALREGARERTGIILAAPGAAVARIDALAEAEAPAFDTDMAQELGLRASNPLADRPVDSAQMLMLGGAMQPYVWTINGATFGNHVPVAARSGQRVELTFHNMSMMAHPMHLHGHAFQVVAVNGNRFAGAVRDTVLVPPMAQVTIAIDAAEAASWMLHCHHMAHLATGMMTEFAISA